MAESKLDEQFESDLAEVSRLNSKGSLRILFVHNGSARLARTLAVFDDEDGSSDRKFLSDLEGDRRKQVEIALSAAAAGIDAAEYLERGIKPGNSNATLELASQRLAQVSDLFELSDLQGRAWLRATALSEEPVAWEWAVATKYFDDTIPEPESSPIAYAELKLITQSNLGEDSPRRSSVVINLDREDVDSLLESVIQLRAALRRATSPSRENLDGEST